MAKISIIIPIYNAENTLEQCLLSVARQTIDDTEIILVDDGSNDSSPQICDKYASIFDNIKVIHKINEGMGKAYNLGISIAKGEYIGFVESDDWIEDNMYQSLYDNAKTYDSDIVKCGLFYSTQNQDIYPILERDILNKISQKEQPFTIFDNKELLFYHSSVWASLYKSDFIKSFRFSEEPEASYQDFGFAIKTLVKAKKISAVNDFFYHWRLDNENSSVKRTDKKLMRILEQAIQSKEFLINENVFEYLKPEFYKQTIISCLNFYNNIDVEYKKEFFDKLHDFFKDIDIKDLNEITKYFEYDQLKFILYVLSGIF